MRYGSILQRRLENLEAALNVLSTEDKWTIVHDRARQLTSDPNCEGQASLHRSMSKPCLLDSATC
jgi:hypothetical protein